MTDPILSARGMSYGYRRDRPIFDDMDLHLRRSSMIALTGPSGTGKSTLLYLLAGLLTPWSGEVLFEGQSQTTASDPERARTRATRFGFVFQDAVLDPRRTVLDAVVEPGLYSRSNREALRQRAQLLLTKLQVAIPMTSKPGQVSGGQAQRVGVCRALLMEPAVVFADEPTGNLDSDSADAVLGALSKATESGSTVIIATHDDRVVARCDERVVLP